MFALNTLLFFREGLEYRTSFGVSEIMSTDATLKKLLNHINWYHIKCTIAHLQFKRNKQELVQSLLFWTWNTHGLVSFKVKIRSSRESIFIYVILVTLNLWWLLKVFVRWYKYCECFFPITFNHLFLFSLSDRHVLVFCKAV